MAVRWDDAVLAQLGDFLPWWHPGWTPATWLAKGLPAGGQTAAQRWVDKLPYDVEQTVVYLINLQPWELRLGSGWQMWPKGDAPPWQCALKRHMGSPATATAVACQG